MNRRAVVVPILLAGAATGCSTFSDNDAAARVEGFELSQEALGDLLVAASPEIPPTPDSAPVDESEASAQTARELLNVWIVTRILETDLAAEGQGVSPEAIADVTGAFAAQDPAGWAEVPIDLQNLQVAHQAALQTWSAFQVAPPSDDELRAAYDVGTAGSGIVCGAQILVATENEAQDILDRLEGGADFAELAASESTDTASSAAGGNLPCDVVPSFAANNAPELVEAALAADIGEPVGPVQSDRGYHVIVLRPSDEIDPAELAALYTSSTLRFQRATKALDIYVDPRFGSFNSSSGVVALG